MAHCFMQLVCKVGHFTDGNKLPACGSFVCLWCREWRGNVALLCNYKQVDWCFKLVAGSIHCNSAHSGGIWIGAISQQQKNPVCQSFVVWERRGWWDNVSLFSSCKRWDWCFQRIAGSAHCNIVHAVEKQTRAVHPRQTTTCFLIFYFLPTERTTRKHRPLLQLQT